MNTKKNHTKNVAVISGTLVTGLVTGMAGNEANANDLFNFSDLGTGYELRNEMIDMNKVEAALQSNTVRAKVWEDKCGEGKCGEGKCGEEKKKEEKKKEEMKKEAKEGDEKKAAAVTPAEKSKTEEAKKEEKKEEKTKEAKCGEGKCGM